MTRSERWYRALVRVLYPRTFSEHYERELALAFGQWIRDAHAAKGALGVAAAWMTEVPALVIGAISERSSTMAQIVRSARRARTHRALVAANASVLALLGVAMLFAPLDVLAAYEVSGSWEVPGTGEWAGSPVLAIKMMAQTLGAALLASGLVAMVPGVRTVSGRRSPIYFATANVVLAFAFAVTVMQYSSLLGWLTVAVLATFAAAYVVVWAGTAAQRQRHGVAAYGGRTPAGV